MDGEGAIQDGIYPELFESEDQEWWY
jgi:hypothetical protein